jgi:hypothetical protein
MLRDLIIATYNELPAPKPKKRKDTKWTAWKIKLKD